MFSLTRYWVQALAAYRRSDALLPDLADTHLHIGRALELLGQPELAVTYLTRSRALAAGRTSAEQDVQRLRIAGSGNL
jgi:hypothetical protein